jgi:rhodanese-related sulfurtransferase
MKIKIPFALLIFTIFLANCTKTNTEAISLTPQEAEELISNGGVIIFDVRAKEFFEKDHLEHAISLPYNMIQDIAASVILAQNQAILVYCQSGEQSPDTANILTDLCYQNVYFLEGGLDSWHGPIVGEWGLIEFNYSIVSEPDIKEPFSFVTERSIHESLGTFTFVIDGYYIPEYKVNYLKTRWVLWNTYRSIHTISIKNTEGMMLQVINDLDTMNEHARENNMFGLTFQDWNFDGYLDISLKQYLGGTSGNRPEYYWLWDTSIEQFMLNDDLMGMNAPIVDTENRLILDASKGGGGYFCFSSYKHTNGRFVEVHRTIREIIRDPEDSDNIFEQTTETNFVTGEVTVTKEPYGKF